MKPIDQTKIVEQYGGQWVVLDKSRTRVLSADATLKKAIEKFKQKFGRRALPMVFKVPTEIMPFVG